MFNEIRPQSILNKIEKSHPNLPSPELRAPIYENFNSLLASGQFSNSAKITASVQNHKFCQDMKIDSIVPKENEDAPRKTGVDTKYPHITVPIKHPEGAVDIHMRFDRGKSVWVLFSGSNPQIVALLAQHREAFIESITNQGYEPTKIQFNQGIKQ